MAKLINKQKLNKQIINQTQIDCLIELMSDNDYHTASDIADNLNCTIGTVHTFIAISREKFRNGKKLKNGKDIPWICSTKRGFTIDPTSAEKDKSGFLAISSGANRMINARPLHNDMRSRGISFNTLKIEYKPKLLVITKLFNK